MSERPGYGFERSRAASQPAESERWARSSQLAAPARSDFKRAASSGRFQASTGVSQRTGILANVIIALSLGQRESSHTARCKRYHAPRVGAKKPENTRV